MGYTPTLIIKYDELKSIQDKLEDEAYLDDGEANYLLYYLKNNFNIAEFEGTKIVVCEPDGSSLNSAVRDLLDRENVYYVTCN